MKSELKRYAKGVGCADDVLTWIDWVKDIETKDQSEVEHILDYFASEKRPARISQMLYSEAKSNTEKWNKALQKKGADIKETETDVEVVLDFGDGFKVVKLIGENAYKREGFLMRHCVASYYGRDIEVYSLRDKDNMPHCTMEKDQQVKGKGNGDIHPKYIEYVVKFLEHVGMSVGDSEMKHLGYVNITNLLPSLNESVKQYLYNNKYYPISKGYELLKDTDGEQYLGMDLLDYFPMFTEEETDTKLKLKLNFDFDLIADYHKKTIQKLLLGVKTTHKKNIVLEKNNATVSAGDNAKVSAGDNAKVSAEDNAKVSAGYYATVSAGHNATVSAGYNAKVSAGDNATVSAGHYAKVSAGYYATVSAGHYAKVSAGHNAKVSAGTDSILVAETNSKLSGGVGTILLITKRQYKDNRYQIVDWKAEMVDGVKIKVDTMYKLENGQLVEITE